MHLPTLPFEKARSLKAVRFVDLRSPGEFEIDHIPGAVNVPLFTDDQRAVVGTLYKQESPERAMEEGLDVVEQRLPRLLARILDRDLPTAEWQERFHELSIRLQQGEAVFQETRPVQDGELGSKPLILHCWRGGMRSRSVVGLLRILGEQRVAHLDGGYKAYRHWVLERLAGFDASTALIVLRGPTGIGKTRLLHELERELPGSTVDLEGLARHRSSILGAVGLEPVGSREFESRLAGRLEEMGPPPWFVEGESRKVGDVVVPAPFFQAMENGLQLRLDASMAFRVRLLSEDYLAGPEEKAQLAAQLPFLEKRLGPTWIGRLQSWLQDGSWERVAETLLEKYYDIRYARSDHRRDWRAHLDAESPKVVQQLLEFREEFQKTQSGLRHPVPCADS